MRMKVVLGGEAVNIPKTDVGLGVAFLDVWVDGQGFTSAINSIGSLGYILLETPEVDIGNVSPEQQALFGNLHGRVVKYDISPNVFFKDGGLARIAMTISVQQDGVLADRKIEFQADNCRGVCLVSNALSFSCEMLQMEQPVATRDGGYVLSDEAVATAADAAPRGDGDSSADTASAVA